MNISLKKLHKFEYFGSLCHSNLKISLKKMHKFDHLVGFVIQGYRTGYAYHQPIARVTGGKEKGTSDVEYPPVASSYSHVEDENGM